MQNRKTAVIITAFGFDNLGMTSNPLKELGRTTIVKRAVVACQQAQLSPIIVITGFDGLSVERHLAYYGVIFFQISDYGSIDFQKDLRPALEYGFEKCDQVMILPTEYPFCKTETMRMLTEQEGEVRIPVYQGKKPGFPVLMTRKAFDKINPEIKFNGWTSFFEENQLEISRINTDDKGCICNATENRDFSRIIKKHDKQLIHPYVRLDIDYPIGILNPRVRTLLMMLGDTKSMKTACQRMSISVGKAWDLINDLEGALGYQVVSRRQGGKKGGSTKLTPKGEAILEKYNLLEAHVIDYTNYEFKKIFGETLL